MSEVARPGELEIENEIEIDVDHIEAGADATLHTGERLQKVLARTGVGSRRVCEDLIVDGRVTVNGDVPVLGRRVDIDVDVIELDGVPLPVRPGLVHYLVNKPPGVVSTAEDTHDRPTVVGLVPPEPRVYPVGRLDMDSEGLLVVTNDGELTHRLTHPSYGVPKEYLVHVEGEPSAGAIRRLRDGLELDDGMTAPARVAVVSPSLLRMVIHEGRNRQIRRMCEAVGHPVIRLVRTRIGPLADPSLTPGSYRPLTSDEVRGLAAAAQPADDILDADRHPIPDAFHPDGSHPDGPHPDGPHPDGPHPGDGRSDQASAGPVPPPG